MSKHKSYKSISHLLVLIALFFLFNLSCLSQNKPPFHDYELILGDFDHLFKENPEVHNQIVTKHKFKVVHQVTMLEEYYYEKEVQEKNLKDAMSKVWGCSDKYDLFNSEGMVGSKYSCNSKFKGKEVFVIGYSYFDSLNKVIYIIGESRSVVEEFTKGICPLALHLYNDNSCPDINKPQLP